MYARQSQTFHHCATQPTTVEKERERERVTQAAVPLLLRRRQPAARLLHGRRRPDLARDLAVTRFGGGGTSSAGIGRGAAHGNFAQ